ncbi:MAG: hypothetical protein KC441_15130 [Anaerolineales bacterium]|nr:hypothetical protein [Anaerolineales bacterium]
MHVETVRISRRFQGPPRSSNGGYACGLTASRLKGTITVRLKAPPPLETDLRLESDADKARLFNGTSLIAEAQRANLDLSVPTAPSYEQASQAAESFIGFTQHQFPECFVCGPQRSGFDGLRIFPGPLPEVGVIAAPWVPDQSLADSSGHVEHVYLWSALDCPSGFALVPLPDGLGIVLGELCVSVVRDVSPGDALVVAAWPIGTSGRKRFAGSAIYTADSALVAKAQATWIEIPLSQWQ